MLSDPRPGLRRLGKHEHLKSKSRQYQEGRAGELRTRVVACQVRGEVADRSSGVDEGTSVDCRWLIFVVLDVRDNGLILLLSMVELW